MKVIAFYLPQFHVVPENEQWWGEGYTEWTAVKNAEKLYENHYQPRIPLNKNYYNLLEKDTMKWQALLMKKYGVYGQCFYHYYFQNGKKILQKPAENLLKWKDIEMPFCFSWANESWARTWSKIPGKNSWNNLIEINNCQDDGILLRQNYGDEKEWEEHFNYLVPFFKDSRYIKVKGRPVFIIHKPDSVACLPQMMEKWNELSQKHGMRNVFFIASNSDKVGFDAYLCQEANYSSKSYDEFVVDYDQLCKRIIENAATLNNHYFCGFPGYDDTPRRGRNGEVIENATPDKFYNLMKKLFFLGNRIGNDITFVNAWNEWGEGMYLEPDERYGFAYLESLKKALADYKKVNVDEEQYLLNLVNSNDTFVHSNVNDIRLKKYSHLMNLFNKWLFLKESKILLQIYFDIKGYKRIALYGLGMAGKHFMAEVEESHLEIVYGIDRLGDQLKFKFPVYLPEDDFPEADVIVVSVAYDFNIIYKSLKNKFDGPIISLEEIIDYVEANKN